MTWKRAERGRGRVGFVSVLTRCEDYITQANDTVIDKLIDSGAKLWYWQGDGFELALAYRTKDGRTKVVVGVPSPEGEPEEWCKCMIRKLRQEFDEAGVTDFYATQLEEYNSDHMQEFAEYIDRICPEVYSDEKSSTVRKIKFRRTPGETKMEGRGKDRPLPDRVKRIRDRRKNRRGR